MKDSKFLTDTLFFKIAMHLIAWLFFLSLPFLAGLPFDNVRLILKITSHTLVLAVFYYANTFFLVPYFLKRGKIATYILSMVLSIAIIIVCYQLIDIFTYDHFKNLASAGEGHRARGIGRRIFPPMFSAFFIFALSTSITMTNEWIKKEKQRKEMENEKLISELSFLKSQVSPHFLFNTLNNIYSLSLSDSEHTPDAILKLSHLLRYMLYESEGKVVDLGKEIGYLQNYIDLQKMRITENVDISFVVNGKPEGKMIEPMLLIPFVENAFKHGINYSAKSFVKIFIDVSGNKLFLKVENSLHQKSKEKDLNSGIGLSNIVKRLGLLYPGKHTLKFEQWNGTYTSELNIDMNS